MTTNWYDSRTSATVIKKHNDVNVKNRAYMTMFFNMGSSFCRTFSVITNMPYPYKVLQKGCEET